MFQKAWAVSHQIFSPLLDTHRQGLPHGAVHQGLDVRGLLSPLLHQWLDLCEVIWMGQEASELKG